MNEKEQLSFVVRFRKKVLFLGRYSLRLEERGILTRRQKTFSVDRHHAQSSFSLLNLLGLFIEPAGLRIGSCPKFLLVSNIQNHSDLVVVADKEGAKVFLVEAHKP